MNILLSYNWLKEHVKTKKSPKELAKLLSLHSMSVERVMPEVELLSDKIVLGEILEISKHPNADKLQLAVVSTGKEKHNVVCGAPNIKVGMKIAFAGLGAMVRWHGEGDPVELQPAKIRGEASFGMICDDSEIGLAKHPNPAGVTDYSHLKAKPGTPMAKALGLDDTVLDIEITTNRIDAASVRGMAREVSAITGETFVDKIDFGSTFEISEKLPLGIEIKDAEKCVGFNAIVLKNVKVGPSPEWLQRRLRAAGHSTFNNVVDVTNYVMRMVGHPLHAFDYDKVKNGQLTIRAAKKGEKLAVLDGSELMLEPSMVVVADDNGALSLGGVIGGEASKVTEQTVNILLESASWNPQTIRRTMMKLDKFTDAGSYFNKGLSPQLSQDALRIAADLILSLTDAKVANGTLSRGYKKYKPAVVDLRIERAERIIGAKLDAKKIAKQLTALGFEVKAKKGVISTKVPHWRQFDVTIEEDLIEEVARLYGYHAIESKLPSGEMPTPVFDQQLEAEDKLKTLMKGAGYTETYTYSMISETLLSLSGREVKQAIRLLNPLDEEHVAMRTRLLPSLLEVAAQNQGIAPSQHLYEISHVYHPKKSGQLPEEYTEMAGIVMTESLEQSVREAKGIALAILAELGLREVADYQEGSDSPLLHQTNSFSFAIDKQRFVQIGVVSNEAARVVGLKRPAVAFEIRLKELVERSAHHLTYTPVPKFPPVELDLSVTVAESMPWGKVEQVVRQSGTGLLRSVDLFDVYHHQEGKKSFGFHLAFRSDEKTLEMNEVEALQKKIVDELSKQLQATLR